MTGYPAPDKGRCLLETTALQGRMARVCRLVSSARHDIIGLYPMLTHLPHVPLLRGIVHSPLQCGLVNAKGNNKISQLLPEDALH